MHYNHCHRATAHLQLNILLYYNLQGVRSELKTFKVDSITTLELLTAITFVAKTSEYVDKMWINLCQLWSTWWRIWLRHYATSQKVAGSIPDGVIGIFHKHIPSGRTLALGSTQPLKEMSTRNTSWR
jgi:hypothetical protein